MTSEYIQLAICSFGMAAVVSYLCWCKLRVIMIRQTMFDIRDQLWTAAQRLGALNDPAYLDAREDLNACIRQAHTISLPILIHVYFKNKGSERPAGFVAKTPELQEAIEHAQGRAFMAVFEYVYYYRPFSGIVWVKCVMFTLNVKDSLCQWFKTGGPRQLDLAMQHG